MKYVIYVLVATPLVLGWLFWASDRPPLPPLFNSGIDNLHVRAAPAPPPQPASSPRLARNSNAPRNE
jgi:hypothetical protein